MNKTLIASAVVGVLALSGGISVANANLLEIVNGLTTTKVAEAIGDPGGTNYNNPPTAGATAGPGMPTALGGWPIDPDFRPDPSFNNNLGISGYDQSYLKLDQAGWVTFQFMGRGDAVDQDFFKLDLLLNNVWTTVWDNQSGANGTCGMNGSTTAPVCPPGASYSAFITPDANGLIPFRFTNFDTGLSATNDGSSNIHDNPQGPAYFLGVDPYLTNVAYGTSGKAVYAGFTDRCAGAAQGCDPDHDYEDLVVRISVPEPGSLALLSAGLLGFGALRRRRAVSAS